MNYIDIIGPGLDQIYINTKLEKMQAESLISTWKIYADGSDTEVVIFTSEFGDVVIDTFGYYQRLTFNANLNVLKNETMYNLVGTYLNEVIYRGKFFTTDKDIENYETNATDYTQRANPNNYTILD
jgi:glyceraldehyde-3-phosphate dehydrogenase/erythrose-4-phosphate dehydrogenase|tara:strand:+ start:13964 stop:14341 length:378 start_codon:yes stop_codon:yes gene_type:complete